MEVSLWGDGAQLSFFCSQRLTVHSGNYRALTAFVSCNYTNKGAIGMVLHRSNWTNFSFHFFFFLLFLAASSNRCNGAKKNISGWKCIRVKSMHTASKQALEGWGQEGPISQDLAGTPGTQRPCSATLSRNSPWSRASRGALISTTHLYPRPHALTWISSRGSRHTRLWSIPENGLDS